MGGSEPLRVTRSAPSSFQPASVHEVIAATTAWKSFTPADDAAPTWSFQRQASGASVVSGRGAGGSGGSHGVLRSRDEELQQPVPEEPDWTPLCIVTKMSYSVGHVLNDLCAACWFSYLLVYVTKALDESDAAAGAVLLCGQLADAAATPAVGVLSDRSRGCLGLGKRKSWNVAGAAIVAVCFLLVFGPPFEVPCNLVVVYYGSAAALFNVGWAANQVSHLTLAPELTNCATERTGLYSKRYAFTVLANIAVFGLFAFFTQTHGVTKDAFRKLAVVVVALGVSCTAVFALGVREKGQVEVVDTSRHASLINEEPCTQGGARMWLRNPRFHRVSAMYTMTRLVVNCAQVYLPVALSEMNAPNLLLGLVPMEVYGVSFLMSFGVKNMSRKCGRAAVYTVGTILTGTGAAIFGLHVAGTLTQMWLVHVCAVLIGAGTCGMLVTSIALQADLIGVVRSSNGNGFVYGYCSMLDKLSNGVIVFMLQLYIQQHKDAKSDILSWIWFGIAGCTVMGRLLVYGLSTPPAST